MKVFIIYTPNIKKSNHISTLCLNSFNKFNGWGDVVRYSGCTPKTLSMYEKKYSLKNLARCYIKPTDSRYPTKKSCFYGHYSLWHKCIELNEPIVIVEHDIECINDLNIDLDKLPNGPVQLGLESYLQSFTNATTHILRKNYKKILTLNDGIYNQNILDYPNDKHKCIHGTIGYIINPASASILIDDCIKNGWQKTDYFMNEKLIPVYFLRPSVIRWRKDRELRTSTKWIYE